MTQDPQAPEGGQLGFDKEGTPLTESPQPTPQPQPEPEPVPQPQGESPEQVPTAPEGSQEPFTMPAKFHGKSPEEIARSAVEAEKLAGKNAQLKDKFERELNQIKSAILVQQGQMRTTGYDRQPQYRQPATSVPEEKGGFVDNLLGDQGEQYLEQKVANTFTKYVQGLQHQQAQQLEQVRNGVLQTGDSIIRNLTEESGMDYREADRMIQEELVKDPELYNRLLYQPQTFTYDDIDKNVKELFKRGQENRSKAFEDNLKKYGGIDKETLRQLSESRKRAAAGTPSGGATSHGNSGKPEGKGNFAKWLSDEL